MTSSATPHRADTVDMLFCLQRSSLMREDHINCSTGVALKIAMGISVTQKRNKSKLTALGAA